MFEIEGAGKNLLENFTEILPLRGAMPHARNNGLAFVKDGEGSDNNTRYPLQG